MNVLVLGASGIVGQHMRVHQPVYITATYARQTLDLLHDACDLTNFEQAAALLQRTQPDVIVNLAGESRPDVVEQNPDAYRRINVDVVKFLLDWARQHQAHLVQVSSQSVFAGDHPPYHRASFAQPVNAYGWQKAAAEEILHTSPYDRWTIARLTFVLGVRPLPLVGRENPLEQMIRLERQVQTHDRWFSPLFAHDAAEELWQLVINGPHRGIVHIGVPESTSRHQLALQVKAVQNRPPTGVEMVSQDTFTNAAPRPRDTTYGNGSRYRRGIARGLAEGIVEQGGQFEWYSVTDRAVELAYFFKVRVEVAKARLDQGFVANHHQVTEDFRAANPQTDDDLLRWYRETTSYCWELSAYHLDMGFNYRGMCTGIAEHLVAQLTNPYVTCPSQEQHRLYLDTNVCGACGVTRQQVDDWRPRVLCLGDGIGDLTLVCLEHGLDACYHDLAESVTAKFATFRFWRRGVTPLLVLTQDWQPVIGPSDGIDAVIALDFFEHMTDVEAWTRGVVDRLRPGGLFLAQNAFAVGDDEHGGSIPMHLSRNNRYEKDWDPLLESLPLERQGNTSWWRKRG